MADLQQSQPGAGTTKRMDEPAPLKPGERIGQYTIREKLGEGGFAIVYLADQTEPIQRRVALKMIKPGMDSRQIVARFRNELQAMAMMEHPNIAKVLDAGTTDAGRAYFVMEYLPGEPITQYCDRHKLETRERLELFCQTCDAVQHAHQKGIIHRDIKPSNVLVSVRNDKPRVKVIDFGVAKAIGHRLTDETVFTTHGQLIGTPEYMSPEQAEMGVLDIDTRSDVYSLGVLLYELLIGELPFDRQQLRSAALAEIQRIIREVEPPKPSTRCSTMMEARLVDCAQHRHTDPSTLQRLVRGDLDWITMRALEKDRSHRYPSASEFSADIDRYLRSEPVSAGPPTMTYRLRKFVRRHRVGVSVAGLTVVLIAAGMVAVVLEQQKTNAALEQLAGEQKKTQAALAETEELVALLRDDLIPTVHGYIEYAMAYPDDEIVAAPLTVYRDFEDIARAARSVDPTAHASLVEARINTIMEALDATYYEQTAEIIAAKAQIRTLLAQLEAAQAKIAMNPEQAVERLGESRINQEAGENNDE